MSTQTQRGLRFAVLLDEWCLAAWQAECISLLVNSGLCELDLMVAIVPPRPPHVFFRGRRLLRHLLWFAFMEVCGRAQASKRMTDDSFQTQRITIRLSDAKDTGLAAAPEFSSVRERQLDFVIYFGSAISDPGALRLARHGVWTFRFGNPECSEGNLPAFWEMLHREPVTHVRLEQYTHKGEVPGKVLRQGNFPVTPHSYARSLAVALSGSVDFPLLVCRELLANGGLRPQPHAWPQRV